MLIDGAADEGGQHGQVRGELRKVEVNGRKTLACVMGRKDEGIKRRLRRIVGRKEGRKE